MPESVTPRRRSRDESDDDDEVEENVYDDRTSSHSDKRPRLDEGYSSPHEEEEEASERPLLPDNYRRSPKGKGRARDTNREHANSKQEHQPGSIVRVTLRNFVTYTNAEFLPGPNLNMVIGPNGTGKSTLVCAICIGLGWSTAHLGRAKDVSEFVKHGFKQAEIEIELKADPERHSSNPVITHRINRDGGGKSGTAKSVWLIDGRKSNAKAVQDLARSFFIQVDNLCQFLPQDRVVEFAALSPVDLLVHTQRAAAPEYMGEWHEELKTKRKEQKQKQTEQQNIADSLKKLEDRQKSQQVEVDRMKERRDLQDSLNVLEQMTPFVEYQEVAAKHRQAQARKKEAAKELRRLERSLAPSLSAIEAKKEYYDRLDTIVNAKDRLLKKTEANADTLFKKLETTAGLVEATGKEIEVERNNGKKAKANISKHNNEIRAIENAQKNPPAPFDPADSNEKIRHKKDRVRVLDNEQNQLTSTIEELKEKASQRREIIREGKKKQQHLQSQAGRLSGKLEGQSPDAARAWEWIQRNSQEFEGRIYGPPMIECLVKDPRHKNPVESCLGRSELMAFTVTTESDFAKLRNQLYTQMRLTSVNIRTSNTPLAAFKAPCSQQELRRLGGDGWLLDLIEGPEAVLAMLCDNRNAHATAIGGRDLSNSEYEAMQRRDCPISMIVTPQKSYQVVRRREYGDHANTVVREIKPATLLTDAPVNTQAEQDLQRQLVEAEGELEYIQDEIRGVDSRWQKLKEEKDEVIKQQQALEKEKIDKQRSITSFEGLGPKLQSVQSKLEDAQKEVQGQAERIMAILDRGDALCQQKCQQALDYARAVDSLRPLHIQLFEAEIMRIEAKSDLEQLQARHQDESTQLQERQREVDQLRDEAQRLLAQGNQVQARVRQLLGSLSDEAKTKYEELEREGWDKWTTEYLANEIQSVQAELDMRHGSNNTNIVKEFEERAAKIEQKRAQFFGLQESLSTLADDIVRVRQKWEPELDALVALISDAFAENFSRIQCAGEVAVYKDEDFENWAIQIKVKFRENEQLSILDSHRQSGGERAVSTIFYLMALQSLARAPFRVVDEINQGMDPRNERLVHSRMVEIACAEHTSQYFLITPKLLNNLTYHPNMKVHCIASGEYMEHRELDFEKLAQKALAIRATT